MTNGILSLIEGETIGAAANSLPQAETANPIEDSRDVTILSSRMGWVCITFQRVSYRHGKSRFWHWLAVRAVRADPQSATG